MSGVARTHGAKVSVDYLPGVAIGDGAQECLSFVNSLFYKAFAVVFLDFGLTPVVGLLQQQDKVVWIGHVCGEIARFYDVDRYSFLVQVSS